MGHMWSTRDPLGRDVLLTQDALEYIHSKDGREDLGPEDIMRAVELATVRHRSQRSAARERLCARGLGPSHWLVVVVDFSYEPALVWTAWSTRRLPTRRTTL